MAIGDSIQRYPLLHLLLSYVCGIAVADVLYVAMGQLFWWCMCLLAVVWLVLCGVFLLRSKARVAFGLLAAVLFFLIGVSNYSLSRNHLGYEWSPEEKNYEARVVESPHNRERSVLCVLDVTAVEDSAVWHRVGRRVFAYLQPCAQIDSLLPGDGIVFRGKVRVPQNFSDDLTFDYARYVTMQGASGTVYLPQEKWMESSREGVSLRRRLLAVRQRLLDRYLYPLFDVDVSGVLAALTLGDKSGLSDEVRAAYSDAGAAHVLALSGLHVGAIYFMLVFLLRGLFPWYRFRWLRQFLAVGVLWLFAFMVGMSPSVVRAVTMCSLYVLARWVSGDSASLHVLSLTALVMLLVNPLYLFDVGFQLSFMAMAAVLCVEPYLEALLRRRQLYPLFGFFVGIVCMSLAAQLGTFPLALYHFGTFPAYFLVTNLIAVSALYVVLPFSAVWWLLALFGFPWLEPFSRLLQCLVQFINACLSHIAQWPGAVLHVGRCNLFTLFFIYLAILFAALFVIKKWPRGLVFFLVALLGLLLSLVF